MKRLVVPDRATIETLAEQLKKASGLSDYQRIQCVLIRATLGSSAAEIARLLGWSVPTVHAIHSRWAKEGEAIFGLKPRGGRRHAYLTPAEEAAFLGPFLEAGGVLDISQIKAAFEAKVNRKVNKTTIYRMLERHGRWTGPHAEPPSRDPQARAILQGSPDGGTARAIARPSGRARTC